MPVLALLVFVGRSFFGHDDSYRHLTTTPGPGWAP
jgi:hypothetical protein